MTFSKLSEICQHLKWIEIDIENTSYLMTGQFAEEVQIETPDSIDLHDIALD